MYAAHTSMGYFPPAYATIPNLIMREHTFEIPADGLIWYFVLTAYDNYGIESDFSNEIHIRASGSLPNEPTNLTVQ